jgi:hypothetical protein
VDYGGTPRPAHFPEEFGGPLKPFPTDFEGIGQHDGFSFVDEFGGTPSPLALQLLGKLHKYEL